MNMANTVCYLLKKDISKLFSKGCLLSRSDKRRKLYTLYPGSGSLEKCMCEEWDLASVSNADYPYIVKISKHEDRFDVFNRKLDWGKKLKVDSKAYVKLRNRPTATTDEYAQVVIKFKGTIRSGMKFGVEILVSNT